MVASECAQARLYRSMVSCRDSSGETTKSAFGSSSVYSNSSGDGRPKVLPKYPCSMPVRCFTRPSRLVPVGVIGRLTSYSDSPSSLVSIASRPSCR